MKMAYYDLGRPVGQEVMSRIHRDVARKLPATSSSRVLDVGGGVGLMSRLYSHRARRVVLTDIARSMLRTARRLNPRLECVACDAGALPFMDDSFDRVLCYSVFHYLRDGRHARRALREFARVVAPGGMILIGDIPRPRRSGSSPPAAAASSPSRKPRPFWPRKLCHRLDKRSFSPGFFKTFCLHARLDCAILEQRIRGKSTSGDRYDVLIRKTR